MNENHLLPNGGWANMQNQALCQPWDMPREMQCRIMEQNYLNFLEVKKKEAIEAIKTREIEEQAKRKADIKELQELRKLDLAILPNGELEIIKEEFGADRRNRANFRVAGYEIFCPLSEEAGRIFHGEFILTMGDKVDILIDIRNMYSREINVKYNGAGLAFGYSHEKETLLRVTLTMQLLSMARKTFLPVVRGWYRDEKGNLKFAFPEDWIWGDVMKYA